MNAGKSTLGGRPVFGRRWIVGLCAIASCIVLAGCGNGQTVVEQDATQFPVAVRLYQEGCNTCHGDNLQGGIGPGLQHVGSKLSEQQIRHQIEVGGEPMPAYAASGDAIFTPQQIDALATWLAKQK